MVDDETYEFTAVSPGMVSPETLLNQLRDVLEVVAAANDVQLAWCKGGRFPVDEIHQSFEMVARTLRPRIREAGLLSTDADARIDELLAYFNEMRALNHRILWQDEGLDEPEWETVRTKAHLALGLLWPDPDNPR